MANVKYSIKVHAPSDDLDAKGREQLRLNLAVSDLDSLFSYTRGLLIGIDAYEDRDVFMGAPIIPPGVISLFQQTEDSGHFRCEVIQGGIFYGMYIRPNDTFIDKDGKINNANDPESTDVGRDAPDNNPDAIRAGSFATYPGIAEGKLFEVLDGDALGVGGQVDENVEELNAGYALKCKLSKEQIDAIKTNPYGDLNNWRVAGFIDSIDLALAFQQGFVNKHGESCICTLCTSHIKHDNSETYLGWVREALDKAEKRGYPN
jgi:hypothetical protein